MGLKTEHVLGLGTAIWVDGNRISIASALPTSRSAAEHLAKNDSDRLIRAIFITYQEEILMAGAFEVRRDVIRILVLLFAIATSGIMGCIQCSAILVNVISIAIDSSTIGV